jgi:lipopolysaccharide transport system ATP-binding protein
MIGPSRAVINRYLDILFGRGNPDSGPERPDTPGATDPNTSLRNLDGSTLVFERDVYAIRSGFNAHEYRWGDGAASVQDFHLSANGCEFPALVAPGDEVVLHLAIRFHRLVVNPILGFTIKTKEGVTVYGTNSWLLDCSATQTLGTAGSNAQACLKFINRLATGDYFLSIGIASRDGENIIPHDRRYDSIHFVVSPTPQLLGLIDLALTMDIHQVHNDDRA